MLKASEALIAWEPHEAHDLRHPVPIGAVAVGPLLGEQDSDWMCGYSCTGGAAYTARRKLFGLPQ
jgi:hypothetical protein